jgi:hypothetical protein
LQILRSQIAKLLQEKEKEKECHLRNQARLKELEIKMQEKDRDSAASLILWHNEKAVTYKNPFSFC